MTWPGGDLWPTHATLAPYLCDRRIASCIRKHRGSSRTHTASAVRRCAVTAHSRATPTGGQSGVSVDTLCTHPIVTLSIHGKTRIGVLTVDRSTFRRRHVQVFIERRIVLVHGFGVQFLVRLYITHYTHFARPRTTFNKSPIRSCRNACN
jgi:hypothetical protein